MEEEEEREKGREINEKRGRLTKRLGARGRATSRIGRIH
jgi:hypothetical protein